MSKYKLEEIPQEELFKAIEKMAAEHIFSPGPGYHLKRYIVVNGELMGLYAKALSEEQLKCDKLWNGKLSELGF